MITVGGTIIRAKRSAGVGYMRFPTSENAEPMIYDSYMASTYPAGNASEFNEMYFYHRDHTGRSGSPSTPLDSGNTVCFLKRIIMQ